jgi:hypothetical protein
MVADLSEHLLDHVHVCTRLTPPLAVRLTQHAAGPVMSLRAAWHSLGGPRYGSPSMAGVIAFGVEVGGRDPLIDGR